MLGANRSRLGHKCKLGRYVDRSEGADGSGGGAKMQDMVQTQGKAWIEVYRSMDAC